VFTRFGKRDEGFLRLPANNRGLCHVERTSAAVSRHQLHSQVPVAPSIKTNPFDLIVSVSSLPRPSRRLLNALFSTGLCFRLSNSDNRPDIPNEPFKETSFLSFDRTCNVCSN
jgi:hypothetical protein